MIVTDLKDSFNPYPKSNSKEIDKKREKISIILSQIGIPQNLVGHKYLITAIDFYSAHYYEDILINDVYQEVSQKHKVRKQRAREDLRYAIKFIDLNS